jgi:predicted RNase H-like nuclease
MKTWLLVGFDSAWTAKNSGAIVGVIQRDDGTYRELGPPQVADYAQAEAAILKWQVNETPTATIVLIDQPTIVKNATGQRPVENLVGSPVSLRHGGMQPASTARTGMFCPQAPVWKFLTRFGGAADPLAAVAGTRVLETYPVLAMIALDWMLPDARDNGRLPKYNPQRRSTFSISDWQHVCNSASRALHQRGLVVIGRWLDGVARKPSPSKSDQDGLDACLCLLVALYVAEQKKCLMVGDMKSGYIVVPYGAGLETELTQRCQQTGRVPSDWVHAFGS